MIRRTRYDRHLPRRGLILVIVLALLSLFAVVGLSFVLYGQAAATAARHFRESETPAQADIDPEALFAYFMGQLVYDAPDDVTGIYSALRGHSLARSLYGLNYTKAPGGPLQYVDAQGAPLNQVPFNGTGRLHTRAPTLSVAAPGTYNNPFQPGIDDYELINYTYFKQDGFLRDPERYGALIHKGPLTEYRPYRTDPNYEKEQPGYYFGGFNAPYTYPDLNNLFLAAVKAGSGDAKLPLGKLPAGAVLLPSFHRPWLFGSLTDRKNANWTNREGKYKILRPRPIDQKRRPDDPQEPEQFPYPEDEGGDVKNLVGSPGLLYLEKGKPKFANNDSLWLDLDFPVLTAPDGRKFKPLFAPLVVDLDNRINLNVHGNLRGTGGAEHASNQGWGAWEVNVGRILNASPPEWPALFRTQSGPTGRYGRDDHPHSPRPASTEPYPKLYGAVDFDGSDQDHSGMPSGPWQLKPPPGSAAVPYQSFPDPPAGYTYGPKSAAEHINHPNLYNPFRPTPPDRAFGLSNLEALLRYGDTGSPALTSELLHLCPQNFSDVSDGIAAARRRGLVTLRSFDFDRPGITPWFWVDGPTAYTGWPLRTINPPFPYGLALASPPFPPALPTSPDSEFGPDGRAVPRLAALRRLDLNRHLPDYPKPNAEGIIAAADLPQFEVAQRARQYLAAEIFEVLWRVTGAGDPAHSVADTPRWNAMRSLAQLAVNIVDFIDTDDYMTPFEWTPGQWVYGTELPRLVLNEAYVNYMAVPVNAALPVYDAHVWVELLNPLPQNPNDPADGQVNLGNSSYSAYEIVLCHALGIRNPDNVTGIQAPLRTRLGQPTVVLFGKERPISPAGKDYQGPGFFVVGPENSTQSGLPLPDLPADKKSPQMTAFTGIKQPITILLRRLACPHLPPQPFTNPYITIDYMENLPVTDDNCSYGRSQPYAGHKSQLRPQAPQTDQVIKHTFGRHNGIEARNPDPKRPGQTLKLPFDWLVHLDRKLVSPMELLHVSAFKPQELTQEFMSPSGPFHHRAPWFDEDLPSATNATEPISHRLYRALEFLGTHNQTTGMMTVTLRSEPPTGPTPTMQPGLRTFVTQRSGTTATGGTWEIVVGASLIIDLGTPNEEVVRVTNIGSTLPSNRALFEAEFIRPHEQPFTITPTTISERVPGKINLNTIWDAETLLALCDPQPSNAFTEAQLAHVFRSLLTQRSPAGRPSKNDKPFRSSATGLYKAHDVQFPGNSIENTVVQSRAKDPNHRRLLEVPVNPAHPALQYQLLNKLFNQVTVRSNVFAVWITVGFFEVTDDTSRPVKLGREIGHAENRQIRHRMFAIVDRSLLQYNPGPQSHFNPRTTPSPGSSTGMVVPYFSIIE